MNAERFAKVGKFYLRESVIRSMQSPDNSIHTRESLAASTGLPESMINVLLTELHKDGRIIPFFDSHETQKYILSCNIKAVNVDGDLRRLVEVIHELTDVPDVKVLNLRGSK